MAHLPDGKSIVVTSWTVLLEVMADAMDAAGEAENRADLRQLQSLVDRMDLEGFRPFSITDLTSDTPRLIMRLCGLTDSVAQEMLTRPYVNRKGLRASAGQGWYGHYLKIHGFCCQLIASAPFWAERGLSPLWFRASSADWKFQEAIRPLLASVVANESWMFEERTTGWQGHWVPLRVAEGREREAVVRELVVQVEAIAAQLAVHAQAELEVLPSDETAAVAPPSTAEPS